ncbi:uncharacterized protein GGS22DRAFT_188402 [Annulohypoxylon maeteangense]|uniref:uncharacterized protein n=1 Tax=Annulohypoxylon maeteangense TaxID=1927788 RepID=UPI002007268B|nr:uncharacterized protein GGS22DRAFT_188402 [Annulohypoxylon maeteangense]KAI0885114.1 hypothetical protein GGS22DRAFT_188402 [Annulohypoxylon maeteangense]
MSAQLPTYLQFFMEDYRHLLVPGSTEPSTGGSTSKLFDTVYGLRVTQTEQDGDIKFNFSLVPSDASINAHPEGKFYDYDFIPFHGDTYLDEGRVGRGMEHDSIKDRFPNIADLFKKWRYHFEDESLSGLFPLELDPEQDFSMNALLMGWKIEGFLMACWVALQPDVLTVEYNTDIDCYHLDKNEDMNGEFNSFINNLEEIVYLPEVANIQ